MTSMGVQAVLTILVLFTATAKAQNGGVTFWKTKFTMTCPQEGIWFNKDDQNITADAYKEMEIEYENSKKGSYHCKYGEPTVEKYFFYVKGKVCENCFELDGFLFLTAIIVDVIVTGLLMLIIYKLTKNKSSPGHASKASARSEAQGPPVPSPDYEMLNARTRSQDTYSVVNRTG